MSLQVCNIEPFTNAADKLKKHDVILEIDDISIGDDGTIKYGVVREFIVFILLPIKLKEIWLI